VFDGNQKLLYFLLAVFFCVFTRGDKISGKLFLNPNYLFI